MQVLYPGRIRIWSVGFWGGRKTGKPGAKPLEQGENQQQTEPTYGTSSELNLGHISDRPPLSPLRHTGSPAAVI